MSSVNDIVDKKLTWAKENPSLCFFPFNTLDVRVPSSMQDGDKIRTSCCCNLENAASVNNIPESPFTDLQNAMGGNSLPSECIRCAQEEVSGGVSERIRDILSKSLDELEEFKKTKQSRTFELRILFSNICNLSCRSCDPYSSSTYAKITNNDEVQHLELDVTEINNYWQLITRVIENKISSYPHFYVHFMGGEPLLHRGNRKLVDWLIEKQLNHRVHLRITTSINIPLDTVFLSKIDKFRSVDFLFSIDGVHENYHYVRWPAQFTKTINNLNNLVEYKKLSGSQTNFNYILSPVFSNNNIFYLKDYLDFWYQWMYEKSVSMFFLNTNLLYRTRHLDIQSLPLKYRHEVIKIIDECLIHPIIKDHEANMQHLHNFLISARQELTNWPENLNLWDVFMRHTAEFDVRTNTKFEIYNSRLYDLLDSADKSLFQTKLTQVNKTQKIKMFSINNDHFKI